MNPLNNDIKVSVCIIAYNQEKYIRTCLESILEQETNFRFEVIVGDDCSNDGTRDVIREFVERYPEIVKPVYQEKNIGRGNNNYLTVHGKALGQYVAHMDGDDYALPGKLQAQANILDSKSKCTAVWHRADYFDDAGGFCSGETSDLSVFDKGVVYFEDSIRMGFIGVHSSLMYRRSARTKVPSSQQTLDLYLTWDLLSKGTGYVLNDVLGRYRVAASGSLTVSATSSISRLAIEHAKYFLNKFPAQRENYFIWAISRALVDAKNMRFTTFSFIKFALKNIYMVSPKEIFSNLNNIRKIQVRWNQRDSFSVDYK